MKVKDVTNYLESNSPFATTKKSYDNSGWHNWKLAMIKVEGAVGLYHWTLQRKLFLEAMNLWVVTLIICHHPPVIFSENMKDNYFTIIPF